MKRTVLAMLMLLAFSALSFGQESTVSADQDSTDETEWDDWFMPGVGYQLYLPRNTDFGMFQGVVPEFVIFARHLGKRSDYGGPGRVKVYMNIGILTSSEEGVEDLFRPNFGMNLSFEGKTKRKFLVPYFGVETGGIFQRGYGSFQVTPLAGVQLVSTKKVLWTVQGGYQYATRNFQDYSGVTASSVLSVLLWK